MPWGLKNQMVNLHTTITMVKIDHTIRPLLTHMVPPLHQHKKMQYFSVGGEGIILPPLPTMVCLEEEAINFFFLNHCNVTSSVIESKDDPTQMTKAVIYNYILYYIQKTIHSKHICKNVHS